MKRALLTTLLLLAAASAPAEDEPQWLGAGELDLAKYEGQVVLVDFWASWCKPCKESMPWLSAMQEKYGAQGLRIVAVNIDKKLDSALAMGDLLHEDLVLVHDPKGKLAGEYELQGMPSSYLYDRRGELAASHVGFLAAECDNREAELAKLIGSAEAEGHDDSE